MRLTLVLLFFIARGAWAAVTVPFVGCSVYTNGGSFPGPVGAPVGVDLPAGIAAQLAMYVNKDGLRVLAPRGWVCQGLQMYGSGMWVRPAKAAANDGGPAAGLTVVPGDQGYPRMMVENTAVHYFPGAFAQAGDAASAGAPAPVYLADRIKYLSQTELTYITPAGQQGLANWGFMPAPLDGYGFIKLTRGPGVFWTQTQFILRLGPGDAALRPYILGFMK
jgi:hypothetical protein